jgi:carbon storage regulator CsrA
MVGEHVIVTVLDVQGSRVRLGITAPDEMPIRREEILPRMEDRLTALQQAACV